MQHVLLHLKRFHPYGSLQKVVVAVARGAVLPNLRTFLYTCRNKSHERQGTLFMYNHHLEYVAIMQV